MDEFPLSRMYADAGAQIIYGGTNEIMKKLIARTLQYNNANRVLHNE